MATLALRWVACSPPPPPPLPQNVPSFFKSVPRFPEFSQTHSLPFLLACCLQLSLQSPAIALQGHTSALPTSQIAPTSHHEFLDFARVLSASKTSSLLNDIHSLQDETGWKLRVLTRSDSSPSVSGKELNDLWMPDGKTVIVIEDLSSPNVLNFNTGLSVNAKLPRQFFIELQSRYGNQFFVQQEGEGAALISTVNAIEECLRKPEGCNNVPGLTNDLYYLTLSTSIAGGCVFGFGARVPPSGRVQASWQWLIILSPLWLLLFGSFGILPVIGRTTDLEPLLKNTVGFLGGAVAIYLTPIFGPSPFTKRR